MKNINTNFISYLKEYIIEKKIGVIIAFCALFSKQKHAFIRNFWLNDSKCMIPPFLKNILIIIKQSSLLNI